MRFQSRECKLTLASSSNSFMTSLLSGSEKVMAFFDDDSSSVATAFSTTELKYCDTLRTVLLNRPRSCEVGSSISPAISSALLRCNPTPIKIIWREFKEYYYYFIIKATNTQFITDVDHKVFFKLKMFQYLVQHWLEYFQGILTV